LLLVEENSLVYFSKKLPGKKKGKPGWSRWEVFFHLFQYNMMGFPVFIPVQNMEVDLR